MLFMLRIMCKLLLKLLENKLSDSIYHQFPQLYE